ncbi:MAG: hypothetical protein OXC57_03795 [Rhodobacteraceae bacterium]|nr:hypothetical protein [Paracoccaceae bacterium]
MQINENKLNLSIWRPVKNDRRMLFNSDLSGDNTRFVEVGNDHFHEELYFWNSGPNDIFGSCSEETLNKLFVKIRDPFSDNKHPEERRVPEFHMAVNEMLEDPLLKNKNELWVDCQDIIKLSSGELNLRANLVQAVLLHFNWVSTVFLNVPKASVLIR